MWCLFGLLLPWLAIEIQYLHLTMKPWHQVLHLAKAVMMNTLPIILPMPFLRPPNLPRPPAAQIQWQPSSRRSCCNKHAIQWHIWRRLLAVSRNSLETQFDSGSCSSACACVRSGKSSSICDAFLAHFSLVNHIWVQPRARIPHVSCW